MKIPLKILMVLTLLTGCGDRTNIKVIGQITDEETGEPINNADISASCWYHHNIDDASLDRKTVKTDNSGKFAVDFEKGYAVNLVAKAKNYEPKQISNDLNENEISFAIKLRKAKANPTLISFTDKNSLNLEDSEKDPYLRVRFQGLKSRQLDFNNVKTYGFDFSSQTTKIETANCDIWFDPEKKEGQPTILRTNKSGGLLPIFENEIKSSLLYEKDVAPKVGYTTEYKLKGNEVGFFVLCRDGKTYAKIIFDLGLIDISSPDGKGSFYKEFGRKFRYLYQPDGSTNLAYPNSDIDPENI
ncbi:MAG: hypothetical protein JSU07_04990 [Bacteroidetes bacterium]|nr:hypothetical protein [Bacteroidota bacterium]